MKKSKVAAFALVATSLVLTSCSNGVDKSKMYTYRTWANALADKWNPHTWENSADSAMLGYVTEGFVGIAPKNTATGEWQWTYDLAESVTDVTNAHKQDLVTYGVMDAGDLEDDMSEYVYEIKLRQGSKFEEKKVGNKTYGGYEIKAEHYVESMKLSLDPVMKNYRANSYYSDDAEIAGADKYFHQGSTVPLDNCRTGEVEFTWAQISDYKTPENQKVYFAYDVPLYQLDGDAWTDYVAASKFASLEALDPDETGMVELNATTFATVSEWATTNITPLVPSLNTWDKIFDAGLACYVDKVYGEYSWDGVGLYKVDDYTFRYVLQRKLDINNFKTNLTSNWLVEPNLYKDLSSVDATTGLKTTTYGTNVDTTVSYGPYKLTNFEAKKQVKFEQNEYWRGYTRKDNGTLYAESLYDVNGSKQQLYQTTHVVIDVMDQKTAKQAFEKGELNDYAPTADELVSNYARSSQLYKEPETYTMRLFFNTNLTALQGMDADKGNTNSVVMSNATFRKAFSLAIDRADWITNTEGYVPAYSLINSLYYYDVFNDPASVFRNTNPAKQAICDLYGITWGPSETYKTLDEAYNSVTGYNLTEARTLMAQAFDELHNDPAINLPEGANIKIRLAWKKGALESPDYAQVTALNKYLTAALEGSGFGTIELEAVGNIEKRYEDVPNGNYAIGYGAWGGAAFYPFTMFRVYMDPSYVGGQNKIHEGACWNPASYSFTLSDLPGESDPITRSAQAWSRALGSGGEFEDKSMDFKVAALAQLERKYIELYYCIPLATSTVCTLLGYQQDYFAQEFNTMYGFGGLSLFRYKYNDAQWEAYVKSQGGTLDYTK